MATLTTDVGSPYTPAAVNLATAQTGNGASTNIIDRGGRSGPALLQIVTTVGGGPTCTYAIEGSADGTGWFAIPYTDPSAPDTSSVATFAITSATTTRKYLRAGFPWRYVRITLSANTNVTSTIDVFFF
jgi:hypothetical protein